MSKLISRRSLAAGAAARLSVPALLAGLTREPVSAQTPAAELEAEAAETVRRNGAALSTSLPKPQADPAFVFRP
jgi:hypothetical protein